MVYICIYFQVHQPFRLKKYTFFDIGKDHFYEDEENNKRIFERVAQKCYLPANKKILELIQQHQGKFKVSFSITGTALEQMVKFSQETLESFQKLAETGCVEFIGETYYHSLAALYSENEFKHQVALHQKAIHTYFGNLTKTFRNTELIYNNDIARMIESLGFRVILAEGADKILGWRSQNFLYQPKPCDKLALLLKNYQLSDDIAFRFSHAPWLEYPLTADKFAAWLHRLGGNAETVNLFMDYETFGEHQWKETGIFDFLEYFPAATLSHPHFEFATPFEVGTKLSPVAKLDVPDTISWADTERDISAWRGNSLQEDALESIFDLEDQVLKFKNPNLLNVWRKLQTSDHFYYMSTKSQDDGTVHKYFNHYGSPYDAYINYHNVLSDFRGTLSEKGKV